MTNSPSYQRDAVRALMDSLVSREQHTTASRVFEHLENGSTSCVVLAETRSGISEIAIALSGYYRLQLSDIEITDQSKLKNCLYLVTSKNVQIKNQLHENAFRNSSITTCSTRDFGNICANNTEFLPDAIIVDECHYGHASNAMSYDEIAQYLTLRNGSCKLVVISSTPFAVLDSNSLEVFTNMYGAHRYVAHHPGPGYVGIRQLYENGRIVDLQSWERDFSINTVVRQQFLDMYHEYVGSGWILVRSDAQQVRKTLKALVDSGVDSKNIYIVGNRATKKKYYRSMDEDEFIKHFQSLLMFEKKACVVTVAGFQAGIEIGQAMTERLIATWDDTNTTVASTIHSSVGIGCGYEQNDKAKHFTSQKAIKAYITILDHFTRLDNSKVSHKVHRLFEELSYKYDIGMLTRWKSFDTETPSFYQESDPDTDYRDTYFSKDILLEERLDINPYIDFEIRPPGYDEELEDFKSDEVFMRN